MVKTITNKVCNACGKSFNTNDGDNFCSKHCETYFDRYLDEHEDDN